MWPSINNKIVTFLFTPRKRFAALFKSTKKSKLFSLISLEIDEVTNGTRKNNIEHNPEQFKSFSKSFITKNKLENAFVSYAFSHHGISEELVEYHKSNPQKGELYVSTLHNKQWSFRFLCPSDNGQFIFYRVGIPRPLLLQYQLLAVASSHNLIQLTTQFETHLRVYQYIRGNTFRQSQLAHDLERCNYKLDRLVNPEIISQFIHVPNFLYEQASTHTQSVITLFGLYLDVYSHTLKGNMQ